MPNHRVVAFVAVVCVCSSCSGLKPATLPYAKVEAPGFFDIGVGYGRVSNTRNVENDDAEGLMASFKAYPLGRWYSEPKEEALQPHVDAVDRVAVSRLEALDDAKRASFFAAEKAGYDEAKFLEFERQSQGILDWAAAQALAAPDLRKLEDLKKLDAAAEAKKDQSTKGAVQQLLSMDEALRGALLDLRGWQEGRKAAAESAEQTRRFLSKPDVKLAPEVRASLEALISPNRLTSLERRIVTDFTESQDLAPKWHVIAERNEWYNRMSVFYGRSVSNFDSGGLESQVNAVGLGFDVSPDLALQVGWAFYEVDEDNNGQIDSDSSLFVGVSLNLFAFKELGKAIMGVGSEP